MIAPTQTLWKIIDGWPSYEVSNTGLVRRSICASNYRNTTHPGRILKPCVDKDGYLRVRLCGLNGARKAHSVHRLVATAFVSGRLDDLVAAHIDGNCQNNLATNLCWVTQAENIHHKHKHKTIARGARIGVSKLTAHIVDFIKSDYVGRRGQKAAYARMFGVSQTAIGHILSGKTWGHVHVN